MWMARMNAMLQGDLSYAHDNHSIPLAPTISILMSRTYMQMPCASWQEQVKLWWVLHLAEWYKSFAVVVRKNAILWWTPKITMIEKNIFSKPSVWIILRVYSTLKFQGVLEHVIPLRHWRWQWYSPFKKRLHSLTLSELHTYWWKKSCTA